jgi:hypothetical protein
VADLGLADARPDRAIDAFQVLRFLACAPRSSGSPRDERRADEALKRLRRPVLVQKLLQVEVDRRRPDAFAIAGRRDDPLGKLRPRHTAALGAGLRS